MNNEDLDYKIVVPINIAKLNYVDRFVNNCKKLNIVPLYVISDSELKLATRYDDIEYVISPTWKHNQSLVTRKKFFGLDWCFSHGYKYGISIDCDCEILKPISFDKIIETYNKNYYCNERIKHPFIDNIINDSCKAIGIDSTIINYYTWFNDVPIYEKNDYLEFRKNINENMLTELCFDHLMFQYYMVSKEKRSFLKISEVKTIESFIESSNLINQNDFSKFCNIAKPLWKKGIPTEDVYIRLHLDR